MKLFAKLKLDKHTFLKYYKKGIRYFLFNEITFNNEEYKEKDLVFYNCSQDRVESTWYTWVENEKIIVKYLERFPKAFTFEKYDFTLAVKKALYWSNQKSGFIEFARTTKFSTNEVVETTPLHINNTRKTILKTIVFKLRNCFILRSKINSNNKNIQNGKIGVFIKHLFQVQLYKYILAETKENSNFVYFIIDKEVLKALIDFGIDRKQIVYINNNNNSVISNFLKWKYFFNLKNEDWYIWNQLLLHIKEFEIWIHFGLRVAESGISRLLMNEAENGIMGAILGEIMCKNNIVTYNTMNGMKSGQAQDYFINFDKWFVWDEQMKTLLMKNNYLKESQLIVNGHLMEDEAKSHKFQNSFKLNEKKYEGKKVISFFSIRGDRQEKKEAIDFFERYLEKNKDVFLIIRPHPSEVECASFGNLKNFENCYVYQYTVSNSKTTLYDQLIITNLSVCFGSTVALESKWFGVHCISVERREISLIHCIDNETIYLTDELNEYLIEKLINKDRFHSLKNKQLISKQIINLIRNE